MSLYTDNPSADTYLNNKAKSTNYATITELVVGERNGSPNNVGHTLMTFDFSEIPSDADIILATLKLTLKEDGNTYANNNRIMRAYRSLRAWIGPEATWNAYASGSNWQNPGGTGALDRESTDIGSVTLLKNDPAGTVYEITLTPSKIQEMIDGTLANNGFHLEVDTENNDQYRFYSSEGANPPVMTITYLVAVESIPVNLTEEPTIFDITNNRFLEVGRESEPVGLTETADIVDVTTVDTPWTESTFETTVLLRVNKTYSTPKLRVESVSIEDMLNAINTLRCELVNPDTVPKIGHEIELLHGVQPHAASRWSHNGLTWFNDAKINDGNLAHIAFKVDTSGSGSWLKLSLPSGTTKAFRAVRIYAEGTYTATWDVEYSDNDSDWTTAGSGWNSGVDGKLSTFEWDDVGAHRLWRIKKTDAAATGNGIVEVQWSTEYSMVLFHGTIDDINSVSLEPEAGTVYSLTCVDWNQLTERQLVAEDYNNMLAGDIAKDAIADNLAADDITTRFVQDGPTITKIVANYITVRELMSEIADLTGFWWNVDYDKRLHLAPNSNRRAPFTLASEKAVGVDATAITASVSSRKSREQYRNHQFLRAGHDITDIQTETFVGDGERKTFNVSYPVASAPTIDVDGTEKTVGIRGVDTGFDWYWNKNSNEISQDNGGTALTSAEVLTVQYQGLFPVIVEIEDTPKITERQGVEGGSGVYQAVEDQAHLDGQAIATDKALSLLRQFGRLPTVLSFTVQKGGLQAGQILSVAIPELSLTGDWLIESVSIEDITKDIIEYRCRAVDGEHLGGWVEFFRRFSGAGGTFISRENEVVQSITSLSDTPSMTDVMTPTEDSTTTEWLVDSADVGFSEVT